MIVERRGTPERKVCIFTGSRVGARSEYRDAAQAMARELVRRDYGLVYGGGGVGMMGAVADAVIEAKGEVIGVIPYALASKERARRDVAAEAVEVRAEGLERRAADGERGVAEFDDDGDFLRACSEGEEQQQRRVAHHTNRRRCSRHHGQSWPKTPGQISR